MTEFRMRLTGDDVLLRALKQLTPKVERKVLRQAMREGAKPTLAEAKNNVRAIRRTGEHTDILARKLKIRAITRKRGVTGVNIQTPTRDELGIPAAHKFYWPAILEFGAKRSGRDGTGPPVTAHGYMRRAWLGNKEQAKNQIMMMIWNGIQKETKDARSQSRAL